MYGLYSGLWSYSIGARKYRKWKNSCCLFVYYLTIDSLNGVILYFLDEEAAGGSGDDFLKVDSAWHGDLDSDADSVDSEEEDPLK